MSHIETLILNKIREALEDLQKQGVGYIECELTGIIHYSIDERNIRISVADTKGN